MRAFAWAAAMYVFAGSFYMNYDALAQPPSVRGFYTRTTRIKQWLSTRLSPSDTVQGIEWAFCGIHHAFLELGARPATKTVWGEVLYHHASHPLVKSLRAGFMAQLQAARPRFIVQSLDPSEFIQGADSVRTFPEFDSFLSANYFPALDSSEFLIWEIDTSPTASADREKYCERAVEQGPQEDQPPAR